MELNIVVPEAPEWFKPDQSHIQAPEAPAVVIGGLSERECENIRDWYIKHPDMVQYDNPVKVAGREVNVWDVVNRENWYKYQADLFTAKEKRQIDRFIQWQRYYKSEVLQIEPDLTQFALQAPSEVPDWFQPLAMSMPKRDSVEFTVDEIDKYSGYIRRAVNQGDLDQPMSNFPEEFVQKIQKQQELTQGYFHELEKWQIENDEARTVQWPFAYAKKAWDARNQ